MTTDLSLFGWELGAYWHRHCSDCDAEFDGSKRSSRCKACATAARCLHDAAVAAGAPSAPAAATGALQRLLRRVESRGDLHDRDSAGAAGITMGDLRALLVEVGAISATGAT